MESPEQMCARLVVALEDLIAQEGIGLKARDFATVTEIQARAAPLVEHLAVHGPAVADVSLRRRIQMMIARRAENAAWLKSEIEQTSAALGTLDASQRRVAQVAPAYGRTAGLRRNLCGIG